INLKTAKAMDHDPTATWPDQICYDARQLSPNDVIRCRPRFEGEPMRRREFVTLLGGAAVIWPLPLRAQEGGKSYRVAYLTLAGGQDAVIVKQRLNELGYMEGK